MTYSLGPWDGVPDPQDPDATWATFMEARAETFRALVSGEVDDWAEKEVKKENGQR